MAGNGVGLCDLAVLVVVVLSDAGAKEDGADQSRNAANRVDGRAAGKVNESKLDQPALAVPNPTGFNRVNDRADYRGINAVRAELSAFSHGAGNDCRGCGAEDQVEHKA